MALYTIYNFLGQNSDTTYSSYFSIKPNRPCRPCPPCDPRPVPGNVSNIVTDDEDGINGNNEEDESTLGPMNLPLIEDDLVSLQDTVETIQSAAGPPHDAGGTGKRSQPQYQLGSTNFSGINQPRYKKKKPFSGSEIGTMVRPLKSCFPGHAGHEFLQQQWFKDFVHDIYHVYVMDYLERLKLVNAKKANYLRYIFDFMIKHVPPEFRLGDTPFTQLSLVGGWILEHLGIDIHEDPPDILTVLYHAGEVESGGETVYYTGNYKDTCKENKVVPFKHGQIHVGEYCNIFHGCKPWNGCRYTFNINSKRYVYEFFHNGYYPMYKRWVDAGRPLSLADCPDEGNGKNNIWYDEVV